MEWEKGKENTEGEQMKDWPPYVDLSDGKGSSDPSHQETGVTFHHKAWSNGCQSTVTFRDRHGNRPQRLWFTRFPASHPW